MYAIILAGGSGSRLWPLSRDLYPKQLLSLTDKKSLLQETFERLQSFIPENKIVSITNTQNTANVRVQLSKICTNPIILSEPVSKNTAPATAIATKFISQISNLDEIILAVPSDHLIKNIDNFIETIKAGEELAQKGYIVTFGVKPSYCETGYGYIKVDSKSENSYLVKEFVEKPNLETVKNYMNNDSVFWNSGIFMFKASVLFDELKNLSPEIYNNIINIDMQNNSEIPFIEFNKMPNISFDYAILEKTKNIAMIEMKNDWKDLGSWDAIYDINPKDENGNVLVGNVLDKDSKNSLIYSSSKLVTTIGLEDTVIVETEDAILACPRNRTQDVKQIYDQLKQQNDDRHSVHKTVYRPWGFYTVIAQGQGFLTKIIHVNPKQKLSVQSHNHRSEHWVILSGIAKVVLDSKDYLLKPGESIDIPVKSIHSLQNPYDDPVEIIEVQQGDLLIEEDIIRYEDMYGRV